MRLLAVATLLAGIALISGVSLAEDREKADAPEMFVKEVASAGMKEVKLGEVASTRSQNREIQEFGKHMVQDHMKANKELKQIAETNRLQLPEQMTPEHRQIVQRISRLQGKEFDQAYAKHMVESHKKAIAKFEAQTRNGQDPSIKSFAEKTLPTLKKHLKMAEELAQAS